MKAKKLHYPVLVRSQAYIFAIQGDPATPEVYAKLSYMKAFSQSDFSV
jgi:hypothetical protein